MPAHNGGKAAGKRPAEADWLEIASRRSSSTSRAAGRCARTSRRSVGRRRRATSSRSRGLADNFSRGYIEQAFARLVVEEGLRHGAENEAFLQREDYRLMTQGLRGVKVESRRGAEPPPSMARALADAVAEDPYAFGP